MPGRAESRLRSVRLAAGLVALWPSVGCVSPGAPPESAALLEPVARQQIRLSPPNASAESDPLPAPVPPEPESFTSTEAVAYALRHNPRLIAARAEIERSKAQIGAAESTLLPKVDLLSRYVVTSSTQGAGAPGLTGVVLSRTFTQPNRFVQSELEVRWTLIDFGRTAGRVGQAVAQERVAAARLLRAEQTVALDATTAYFQLLLSEATERTQRDALRWAEVFLADARTRRKAGTADRNDELRADVLKATEADAVTEARRQVAAAAAGLNNALGRNPGLPVRVEKLEDLPPLSRTLAECLEASLTKRPEVAIARDTLAAALAIRQSRAADYRPRVYALASGGYVDGQNVVPGLQGGTGIHLNVPLYDGGLRRSDLQTADAQVAAADGDARKIFDDVALQIHLAYQDAAAARERATLARPAVDQGREYLRLSLIKYKNGDGTPADIADAQASSTRAEDRYHSAAYEYLAALARLGYATGEGPGALLPPNEAKDPATTLPPPRLLPPEEKAR